MKNLRCVVLHEHAYGFQDQDGKMVGVVGDRPIAAVAASVGNRWRVFTRLDAREDCFVAVAPGWGPEDLPIAPGYRGWIAIEGAGLLSMSIH